MERSQRKTTNIKQPEFRNYEPKRKQIWSSQSYKP